MRFNFKTAPPKLQERRYRFCSLKKMPPIPVTLTIVALPAPVSNEE